LELAHKKRNLTGKSAENRKKPMQGLKWPFWQDNSLWAKGAPEKEVAPVKI
jgi:hypothetical protein